MFVFLGYRNHHDVAESGPLLGDNFGGIAAESARDGEANGVQY